jgi:DNA-binding IclR family transcriptional regulator
VKRATQILKLLAAEPRTEFTLSELARRAGISRASCHTLVLALSSSGLVTRREAGPTYKLGLALVALGEAAKVSADVVSLAETELFLLRDKFQASGMAGAISGGDIVIFSVVSPPHPLGYSIAAGTRVYFRAPTGLIYIAWSEEADVTGWLDRAVPPLAKAAREQLIKDLAKIRARGWSASARVFEAGARDRVTVHEVTDREFETGGLNIAGISAPVWDSSGKLVCVLALTAFPTTLSGSQVCEIAAAVKAGADRVTRQLGGMAPADKTVPPMTTSMPTPMRLYARR